MIAAKLRPGMRIRWRGYDVEVLHISRPTVAGLHRANRNLYVTVSFDDGNTKTVHFYDNDEIRTLSP